MSAKVLLMGDVDAIKEYVFESSRLPQIRGGSDLLMECEERIRRRITEAGGNVLIARGGFLLAEVPSNQCSTLIRDIHQIFASHTLAATITLVCEKGSPPPHSPINSITGWAGRLHRASTHLRDPFPRRVAFLAARLRAAKESRETFPFWESILFGRKCAICARRTATELLPTPGEILPACEVCSKRHRVGSRARSGIRKEWDRWYRWVAGKPFPGDPPHDLEELVHGDPHGRLAFIYADGNDMGSRLMRVQTPQEYQELSRSIYKATRLAVFRALRDALGNWDGPFWPFELINIGGDDITLLIQAQYALDFAISFLDHFERLLPGLTASCGIMIAHRKYPIRYFEALAADLLKDAKARAKENSPSVSALQFLWLPEPIAAEESGRFLQRYRYAHGRATLQLTVRPYTLDQARRLYELARRLSELLPRSQRHQWAEALTHGVLPSVNFIRYQIARMPVEQQKALNQILDESQTLAGGSPTAGLSFWVQKGTSTWITSLMDILECAELMR